MGGEHALAGLHQPRIFVGARSFSFLGGLAGIPTGERADFYAAAGANPETAFPLRFSAKPGLAEGITGGVVRGFYKLLSMNSAIVETDSTITEVPCGSAEFSDRMTAAKDLAGNGKFADALSLANLLVTGNPSDFRSWTYRSHVHAKRGAIDEAAANAIQAVQCDPSNRDLYTWACLVLTKQGNYLACLQYSDMGLAATAGSRSVRAMHRENLTFLGARALYQLHRYGEALSRLEGVSPRFGMGRDCDDLMTKAGVAKACKTGLALRDPQSGAS